MFRQLATFLRCPTPIPTKERSFTNLILSVISGLLALTALQSILQIIFLTLFGRQAASHEVADYKEAVVTNVGIPFIVILGPVLEESTFRLFLTEFNQKYIKVSAALIAGLLLSLIALSIFPSPIVYTLPIRIGLAIAAYLSVLQINISTLQKSWNQIFPFLFWGSIVLFAIIHSPQWIEYGLDAQVVLRGVISLLLTAFLLSYMRIKYGFLSALVIHCIYNFITTYNP